MCNSCGYPGSEYYLQVDADTFASWDVDMLKLDGECCDCEDGCVRAMMDNDHP